MKKKSKKTDLAAINRSLQRQIKRRLLIEQELRASEEKFRLVADYTYDWEYWINPQGNFNYISPSCKRVTGYSAEEFESNPELLLKITSPDDRPLLAAHLEEELRSEKVCHLDFRVTSKAGEEIWISHFCQPVYGANKEFVGRRASNCDITNRMKMSQALAESERHFRLALDASSDGVWDRNICSGDVFYGENWGSLLGYTDDDIQKKQITWESLLHPDDKPKALRAVNDHLERIAKCLFQT